MVRTVAVLGASNTGKSTLVDRMCGLEGQPRPAAAPGELRVCEFTCLGDEWAAIDTPGSIEFLHVATDALLAADAAVICVGPDPAAAVLASPYLHAVEAAGTPAVIFINRIDEATGPGPRHRRGAAGLCDASDRAAPDPDPGWRARWSARSTWCRSGPGAYREGEPSTLIEIPAGLVEREHEARGELLEHLSEFDDHLLEELIEDREPPSDEVYAICKRVLGENRVIEALIGSGLHGNGIVRVMKALRHEAPGPAALRERLQRAGRDRRGAGRRWSFASAYRKHVGKALMIRSLAPLAAGQTLAGRAAGQLTPADPRDGHHLDAVEEGAMVTRGEVGPSRGGDAADRRRGASDAGLAPAAAAGHEPGAGAGERAGQRQGVGLAGDDRRGRLGADRDAGSGDRRGARRRAGAAAPSGAAPAAEGRLRARGRGGGAEPGLPRDHLEEPGDRLPAQEADRRRRAVRRREADRGAGDARGGVRLRGGGEGRRGAAQLHPGGRDRGARRDGAGAAGISRGGCGGYADRRAGAFGRQLGHGVPDRRAAGDAARR